MHRDVPKHDVFRKKIKQYIYLSTGKCAIEAQLFYAQTKRTPAILGKTENKVNFVSAKTKRTPAVLSHTR